MLATLAMRLPLHEAGSGGDPIADNDRRSDEMLEHLRGCVFVFDCTTPGCDGIPERREEGIAELMNEVISLRCFRDTVAQSGCGYQLKLVSV